MKTIFTVLSFVIVAGLFAFSDPFKNSSGAQPGHTGSPGDGKNCTFCHGGTAMAIDGVFSSNIPANGYAPGESYTITVTTSGAPRKGFQVSPQDVSGNLLGTLTAGAGNKLVGANKYVTHSAGVTAPTAEWSFTWTAPEAGTGKVVFYGAFVIGQPNVRLSTMEAEEDETIGIQYIARQIFNIFPVSGGNYLKVSSHLAEPSAVYFELFDLTGRVMFSRDFGWQNSGTFTELVLLDRNLQNNIYVGVIKVGSQKLSKKIIL
jgi:hypothetical protein